MDGHGHLRRHGLRAAVALTAGLLAACAVKSKVLQTQAEETALSPARAEERRPLPARSFGEPGELDRILDADPLELKPAAAANGESGSPHALKGTPAGKGRYRIQIAAETDFDSAQEKKKEYEKALNGSVDVVFDAPYYKLRWGAFENRQEAEDRLLDLSDHNVQGFVIKQ